MKNENEGITVSINEFELSVVDSYCREHDLTRSQVVAKALRRYISAETGEKHDSFKRIMETYHEKSKV